MELELQPLNVLIGANGAGKSNLVSFFKMLNEMMAGRFQQYTAMSGRASSILHFGPKITPQIEATLEFEVENGVDTYFLRLFHAANDTLIFAEETLSFLQTDYTSPRVESLGAGHLETRIPEAAEGEIVTAKTLRFLLNRCRVYHFHDTSSTSAMRQSCYVGDTRWLMPDAGNLAALLLRFRRENHSEYQKIVRTIRLIAPFFKDFVLEPDAAQRVLLNWETKDSDRVFSPHEFSDGTLRAICLITLLLQPEETRPEMIIVDEPELGLHPYALNIIADLFSQAAYHIQVLMSTQSSLLIDNFSPENIITVNLEGQASQFQRLTPSKLDTWLEEYSLGEIWEKNIIGGGPH